MALVLDVQRVMPAGPAEDIMHQWVAAVLDSENRDEAELTVRIVDENESAALNEEYRGKQGATNVLSFPFECPEEVELDLLGDLVICAPVVEREAKQQGKTSKAHWAHMLVHGTFHLLGYDHIEDSDAEQMESREIQVMASLGFANPYEEVTQ